MLMFTLVLIIICSIMFNYSWLPEVFIAENNDTSGKVSKNTNHQEDGVGDGERYQSRPVDLICS